jgi:hypothetical protein
MRLRLAAALCAAVATTAALAALALAAGEDSHVAAVDVTKIAQFETAVGTATCPAGQRATGGGVDTTTGQPPTANGAYETQGSGPVDETGTVAATTDGETARGWMAGMRNLDGAPQDFRVFALCSTASDAVVKTRTLTLLSRDSGGEVVTCDEGTRAVGGGVLPLDPISKTERQALVLQSGPVDETGTSSATEDGDIARGWFGGVHNRKEATSTFKLFVLCSATSDAIVEADEQTPSQEIVPGAAVCPAGRHVTGGGSTSPTNPVIKPGFQLPTLLVSTPQDDTATTSGTAVGDTARRWRAVVRNNTTTANTYKFFALCESDAGTALAMTVSPARVKVKRRKNFTFTVTSGGAPADGAAVKINGKTGTTGADGTVALSLRFKKRGQRTATATKTGLTPATATITVKK